MNKQGILNCLKCGSGDVSKALTGIQSGTQDIAGERLERKLFTLSLHCNRCGYEWQHSVLSQLPDGGEG